MFYQLQNTATNESYVYSYLPDLDRINSVFNTAFNVTEIAMPTLKDLSVGGFTYGDLANNIYAGMTYDCALPQTWLDNASNGDIEVYDLLRSTVVWLYKEGDIFGQPAPLCIESQQIINELKA